MTENEATMETGNEETIELNNETAVAVAPVVQEEFDWDSSGAKGEIYSAEEREKLNLVYEKTLKAVAASEIIDGKVVAKNSKEVVVNIGYKSDGIVPLSEFRYNPDLKIGDIVEVFVENQEDKTGQLVLSHKSARAMKSWERVNNALATGEIITGYVKARTKGGLIADVFGIEAFLPGSQIDVRPIKDFDEYVGKTMEFKVIKINHEFKNVVVSHKALIEAEMEIQKVEIISKLEKGQVLEGVVKGITTYGVFIDLGGIDGLIHITDLAWSRINHPEEIVKIDEKINVVILDFDNEKKRIALGLKQLTPHPWDSLKIELTVGDKVKGKVVVVTDYGAFVEIQQGVEGLIHVSEMSWSQHLRTAHDFFKVGDEVDAVILTLDKEERKMSLGVKQLKADPWTDVITKYAKGTKHTGTVRNFTGFGIFIELEEGVDGLVHISDLSWSKKIKHPAEFTKVGDKLDVVVLEVDAENRRLSLGHKQLEENPWEVFETIFTIDSVHTGTIISKEDKGAIVSLPYGVEAFCPPRHLTKADKTTAKVEETLEFKILEFNKDTKRIVVSHSKIAEDAMIAEKEASATDEEKAEIEAQKAVKKLKETASKTTLGDVQALSDLQTDMAETEKKKTKKADKKVVEPTSENVESIDTTAKAEDTESTPTA